MLQPLRQEAHFQLCLLERDPRLYPGEHGVPADLPDRPAVGHRVQVEKGGPVVEERRVIQGRGHDAYHRARTAVKAHRSSEHVRVGVELLPPEGVADERHRRELLGLFLGRRAPELGKHAEQGKEIGRDIDGADLNRRLSGLGVAHRLPRLVGSHVREHIVLLPLVKIVRRRDREISVTGRRRPDLHEGGRVVKRERLEHQAVQHRKGCRVDADPKGERHERHDGEPRIRGQLAQRVPHRRTDRMPGGREKAKGNCHALMGNGPHHAAPGVSS